ncbi:hypothetical protein ABMA59_13815 [Mesorhizobium sp. CN2-181]
MKMDALRVAPVLDPSQWVQGANAMDSANKRLDTGLRDVQVEMGEVGVKATRTRSQLDTLARGFEEGYREETRMSQGLKVLSFEMETNNLAAGRASAIYMGMARELGLTANAANLAAQGHGKLAGIIGSVNAQLTEEIALANRAVAAHKQLAMTANDNVPGMVAGGAAAGRRQILGYQAFDIGQGLAGGLNPAMILAQQGPQIAQLYAGQGGLNALWKDSIGILGGVARAAGPWIAAIAAMYGGYKLLQSFSVEASLGVDSVTQALADQAAPLGTVKGQISELGDLQKTYRDAIALTGAASTTATNTIIANAEREFAAKRALLELEGLRQEAALKVNASQTAIAGQTLRSDLATGVNTRMDLERQGFADPRIGSVPFVRLPDEITGLEKTQAMIDASPVAQELKRLRAEGELTRLTFEKLQDAINATVNGTDLIPSGANGNAGAGSGPRIPIPQFRGLDDQPGSLDFMQDAQRQHELRMRGLQDEARLLGLTGAAAASLRAEQEMLAAAYAKNIELSPAQLDAIRQQATAYGEAADAMAGMKLGQDLAFEREQLFRSDREQQIASRLRGTGQGMDSAAANEMRYQYRITDIRDGVTGFLTDFKDELLDNGGDIGDAFAKSILTAPVASDEEAFDALVTAIIGD